MALVKFWIINDVLPRLKKDQAGPTPECIELCVAHIAKAKGLRPITHGVELKESEVASLLQEVFSALAQPEDLCIILDPNESRTTSRGSPSLNPRLRIYMYSVYSLIRFYLARFLKGQQSLSSWHFRVRGSTSRDSRVEAKLEGSLCGQEAPLFDEGRSGGYGGEAVGGGSGDGGPTTYHALYIIHIMYYISYNLNYMYVNCTYIRLSSKAIHSLS